MSTDVSAAAGRPRDRLPHPEAAACRRPPQLRRAHRAARAAFTEHGTGASLEDIARRAEVGIGTLYRNFPTRDALVEAVYVEEVEPLMRDAEDIEALEPWEALSPGCTGLVELRPRPSGCSSTASTGSRPCCAGCRDAIYSSGPPPAEARAGGRGRPLGHVHRRHHAPRDGGGRSAVRRGWPARARPRPRHRRSATVGPC